jgi:hypothetical protein
VLRVWCAIYLFSVLQTDAVLRAFAETPFILWSNLLRLLVVAALIPGCMGRFGLPGAVLAALLATGLIKVWELARIAGRLQTGLRGLLPWRSLAAVSTAAAAAAVPAALVRTELAPASFGLLAASGIAYAVSYLFLAWSVVLTPVERRAALAWAGSALGRTVPSGVPTQG